MKKHFSMFLVLFFLSLTIVQAQVMIFQYRHVPDSNIDEFIKRETTYWSAVAKKAIDDGNLESWALLEKVGGNDLANSPNFLFINVVKNIDAANGAWDPAAVFPDVAQKDMETWSLGTTTHQFYLRPRTWVEDSAANPEKDFNYIKLSYWKSSAPGNFIALEKEHWAPFIDAEMKKEGTSQVAWANAIFLNPIGPDMPGNTISMDIYSTLQETLIPNYPEGMVFPDEGLDKLEKITEGRVVEIYRIVKAVDRD